MSDIESQDYSVERRKRLSQFLPVDLVDELLDRAEENLTIATTEQARQRAQTQIDDLNLYRLHWHQGLNS